MQKGDSGQRGTTENGRKQRARRISAEPASHGQPVSLGVILTMKNILWGLWLIQICTVWLWPGVLVFNTLKLAWMIRDNKKEGYRLSAILCMISIFMLTSFPMISIILDK